jgi:hypothetical protein
MAESIAETARDSFVAGAAIWLIAAFKTRIFDKMPESIFAHTGRENLNIWGDILLQQNLTIYTLAAFVGVGFVYCILAMFTLSYFAWSQTPWYDQMAKEIFQIPPTQATGLFWIKVFFGFVTIPLVFVLFAGLYQLAKLGLWLVF